MEKITWREYPELLWLNLVVKWRNLIEYGRVFKRYYPLRAFRQVDRALLMKYLIHSPYKISKNFLIVKGEEEIYAYGETPLTTLEIIAKECGISDKDTVFELGCGRGRGCFWLHYFVGCHVVGIEYIPDFIHIAQQIQSKYHVQGVEFRLEDMLKANFSGATVIYLYGTCYEQPFLDKLLGKLSKLPKGTKIITISYALTDYSDGFEVIKTIPAQLTWGETDVYLQVVK